METEVLLPGPNEEVRAVARYLRGGVPALFVLVFAGCGGTTGDPTVDGPAPSEMCIAPEVPVVATYDLVTGDHQWHVCGDPEPWYSLQAATDTSIYVGASFEFAPPIVIALDAATGVEQWRGDLARMDEELPDDAARPIADPPTIDGVALTGGQDDPLVATDAATRAELWRNDDHLVYDDVWAVGDGAVYMNHQTATGSVVVAYELSTGDVRWERSLGDEAYPWWVAGGHVFSSWSNVASMSTIDGSVFWVTDYPQTETGFPAPRGVVTNDSSVVVSFASQFGSGD